MNATLTAKTFTLSGKSGGGILERHVYDVQGNEVVKVNITAFGTTTARVSLQRARELYAEDLRFGFRRIP